MDARVRIVLTGGGSGGHVYPLLAVAEALQRSAIEKNMQLELRYLGPRDEWTSAIQDAGIETRGIVAGKLRRYFSLLNFFDIPKFFIGLAQAFWKLFWYMPDAIFSKGGPGAFPVVFAGWCYRVPILIHESDAAPGLTNLLSARFAARIAVSFDAAQKYFDARKTELTGNPVRNVLLKGKTESAEAKRDLNFNPEKPLIFVLGGSQGSQRINEFVIVSLKDIIQTAQILHQTGTGNYADTAKLARTALIDTPLKAEIESAYHPMAYLDDAYMAKALSAADLVVARAGSGAIFEIAAFGRPSILIPLKESANGHQRANAYAFAKTGGAVVVEEANLLPGIFLGQVKTILSDAALREKMGAAAASFFKPGAAKMIAGEILKISRKT